MKNNVNISKFMSGLLRHFPEEYNLSYDSNGWFNISDVVECIRENKDSNFTKSDIKQIVENDSKGRYELNNNKVRAAYGHSINVTIEESDSQFPDTLYHGTPKYNIKSIRNEGLQPQSRQKVHMTDSIKEAENVGQRHSDEVIVLHINAEKLSQDGFNINNPTSDSVYTVSEVPPDYITEK